MAELVPGMLESFPFDSSPDVIYDDEGYPQYDRAVGARVMRDTFKKFFSNGVFPNPGSELILSKGDGLSVKVGTGGCIINGAFGIVYDEPKTIKLEPNDSVPHGNIAYAIMVRYDNTDDWRCIRFRVAKSEAASNPVPPMPEQTTPEVMEYRLGYVVVQNGATDLSKAQLVNEKGLAVCPYAAPFVEIDVSSIVEDFRRDAGDAYNALVEQLDKYYELIQSAIDGTTAGHLQNQISDLKKAVDALAATGKPLDDPAFVEYVFQGV